MLETTIVVEIERAGRQCAAGNETADAGERRARERAAPGARERGAVGAGREREDQFVVLAIGERGTDVGAGAAGQGGGVERGPRAAWGEGVQVLREAVAHVH